MADVAPQSLGPLLALFRQRVLPPKTLGHSLEIFPASLYLSLSRFLSLSMAIRPLLDAPVRREHPGYVCCESARLARLGAGELISAPSGMLRWL